MPDTLAASLPRFPFTRAPHDLVNPPVAPADGPMAARVGRVALPYRRLGLAGHAPRGRAPDAAQPAVQLERDPARLPAVASDAIHRPAGAGRILYRDGRPGTRALPAYPDPGIHDQKHAAAGADDRADGHRGPRPDAGRGVTGRSGGVLRPARTVHCDLSPARRALRRAPVLSGVQPHAAEPGQYAGAAQGRRRRATRLPTPVGGRQKTLLGARRMCSGASWSSGWPPGRSPRTIWSGCRCCCSSPDTRRPPT